MEGHHKSDSTTPGKRTLKSVSQNNTPQKVGVVTPAKKMEDKTPGKAGLKPHYGMNTPQKVDRLTPNKLVAQVKPNVMPEIKVTPGGDEQKPPENTPRVLPSGADVVVDSPNSEVSSVRDLPEAEVASPAVFDDEDDEIQFNTEIDKENQEPVCMETWRERRGYQQARRSQTRPAYVHRHRRVDTAPRRVEQKNKSHRSYNIQNTSHDLTTEPITGADTTETPPHCKTLCHPDLSTSRHTVDPSPVGCSGSARKADVVDFIPKPVRSSRAGLMNRIEPTRSPIPSCPCTPAHRVTKGCVTLKKSLLTICKEANFTARKRIDHFMFVTPTFSRPANTFNELAGTGSILCSSRSTYTQPASSLRAQSNEMTSALASPVLTGRKKSHTSPTDSGLPQTRGKDNATTSPTLPINLDPFSVWNWVVSGNVYLRTQTRISYLLGYQWGSVKLIGYFSVALTHQ